VVIAALWRLLVVALVIGGIGLYIWGGSTDAHLRCLAHRFGDNSLIGTVACAVEH
jgi:hypothetical protein